MKNLKELVKKSALYFIADLLSKNPNGLKFVEIQKAFCKNRGSKYSRGILCTNYLSKWGYSFSQVYWIQDITKRWHLSVHGKALLKGVKLTVAQRKEIKQLKSRVVSLALELSHK